MNLTSQINYDTAIKRWCARVDEYNAKCITITKQRSIVLPSGETITRSVTYKKGTIKAAVKSTGMHLISKYADAWAAANCALHGMAKPSEVHLRTNRVEIGTRLNRSERSVYDHIRKLIEVGLVDNYEFCGRQHSFKLWINPTILFGDQKSEGKENPIFAPKTALSSPVRQNLPPFHTTHLQPSTTIIAVECGQTQKHNHGNNEDPHSPAQKGQNPAFSMPSTETRQPGGRGAVAEANAISADAVAKFRRLPAYFKNLALNFWLLARTNLYPGKQFSDHENNQAMLAIVEGVFGGFRVNQPDREWDAYYNQLVQRVNMATDWFTKNANRKPDLPYQNGKKLGYFDQHNNFGFVATASWLEKDQLRRRHNRVEYLLNQARVDFEKLAAGSPRPKVQHFTELQLFVYYQNLAKGYGKEVEEKFCNQYLKQKALNFLPAKRQTISIRAAKAAHKKAQVVYVEPWMEMGESFYS